MFVFSHEVDQKNQEESQNLPPFPPDIMVVFSILAH